MHFSPLSLPLSGGNGGSKTSETTSNPNSIDTMKLKKLIPWNWFKHEDEMSEQPLSLDRGFGARDARSSSSPSTEIDRLIGGFFNNNSWPSWPNLGSALQRLRSGDGLLKPTMDISESRDRYTLTVEFPGVEKDDVTIQVEDGRLVISGEKRHESEEEGDDFHRIERSYGMFRRVLDLPPDTDAARIDAKFKNGVLTLKLPKDPTKRRSARVIEVS